MGKYRYYAVKAGRKIGIFESWDECEASVKGFKGHKYKGFALYSDAESYLSDKRENRQAAGEENSEKDRDAPYAFIDGSFNPKTNTVGWGGFIIDENGREIVISGSTGDIFWTQIRNVAGEILGCLDAIDTALRNNMGSISVYYDYKGIEQWANGGWKANLGQTREYAERIRAARENGLEISFVKVKGHSNVAGNDRADAIAKKAAGIA